MRKWFASHYRRVGIESTFSDLKSNIPHKRRGYFRIFGLTAHRLLLGITLAAMNVLILRYWHLKRDLPDPWGTLLGEPEPRRTTAHHHRTRQSSSRPAATARGST